MSHEYRIFENEQASERAHAYADLLEDRANTERMSLTPAEEKLAAEIERDMKQAADQVKVWNYFLDKLMGGK
jgi:hypothetical protein